MSTRTNTSKPQLLPKTEDKLHILKATSNTSIAQLQLVSNLQEQFSAKEGLWFFSYRKVLKGFLGGNSMKGF